MLSQIPGSLVFHDKEINTSIWSLTARYTESFHDLPATDGFVFVMAYLLVIMELTSLPQPIHSNDMINFNCFFYSEATKIALRQSDVQCTLLLDITSLTFNSDLDLY